MDNTESLVVLNFLVEKLDKYSDPDSKLGQDEGVSSYTRALFRECIKIVCRGIAERNKR